MGIERIEQIRYAIVERNGSIAVMRRSEEENAEMGRATLTRSPEFREREQHH